MLDRAQRAKLADAVNSLSRRCAPYEEIARTRLYEQTARMRAVWTAHTAESRSHTEAQNVLWAPQWRTPAIGQVAGGINTQYSKCAAGLCWPYS